MTIEVCRSESQRRELIPILQPWIVRDGSISGLRGQDSSFARARNFSEVRRDSRIDVAARSLIALWRRRASDSSRRGVEV